MELVAEVLYDRNLLLRKVIALELLNSILFVLHPQNPAAIKIKWHIYFWDVELTMGDNLALFDVDFVQVLLLQLQVSGCIDNALRMDSRF